MIIVASDTRKLSEPGFDGFTIYGDGEMDVRVMGPEGAYAYARDVVGGRWLEAEDAIKRDPEWACCYTLHIIKGRRPEAEEFIKQDLRWVCYYARDVIKGRWLEAEDVIKRDPEWAYEYARLLLGTSGNGHHKNFSL